MARTISATEAQAEFDELIELIAENDETVVVEQDGIPRVVLMSLTAYRQFSSKAAWESWEAQLAGLHQELRPMLAEGELPSSVEIIQTMREERDEQLLQRLRLPDESG
jgi:PHD/YefM family antitoxin component YafN of YafNO toxin-antitoxin module